MRNQAEEILRRQEEWLRVTLNSIGDAVIATDADGRVTALNPVASSLTGWSAADALGRPLTEVFPIFHEITRQSVENPVAKVIKQGVVIGLGNHTLLRSRNGAECPIDDSAAPIKDEKGNILGVVLVFRDVTERRQVERLQRELQQELERQVQERTAELRASEERFRLLVEGTKDYAIFMLDSAGHVVSWNPAAERIKGYRAEEIIGQHFSRFYPEEAIARRWPEYELERAAAEGRFEDEGWRLRQDGSRFWANVIITALRDEAGDLRGFSKITRDLSERKQAEENARRLAQEQAARQAAEEAQQQLRANQEQLHFLADASTALATVVDYESTLRKVARLAVPFFADWSAVDIVEPDGSLRRLAVAHADPSKVELANELHRRYPPRPDDPTGPPNVLRTGRPELVEEITDEVVAAANLEEEPLRVLRELRLRSYICVPLAARGKVLGTITFLTAAESERRYGPADLELAEDLAHRAAIAIDNALLYEELREADRKKDEFLAILAHELRNPLAPLSNALQILRLTGINKQAAEIRDLMERQVRQMTRLVDDLLDVSRVSRGKIELRRERLDVAEVVLSALETSRPLIEAGQHDLTVTPAEEPLFIEGDKTRLAQVLSNLLTNAAKYTPERGRIWLSVEASGVASAPRGEVRIRVRDSGVGIPADMLPKVFDMFTQVERHAGRSQGGLGIGLTLVRSLVQMHGGRVEARSGGQGQGSEFIVHLPLTPQEPTPAAQAEVPSEAPPGDASPQRRILVVDDNVDSAESLALMLRLSGNEVRTAHDGPSALRAAAAFVPEVVLLDIGMPGMDGHEVARRMRQMPPLRNALLIAQTGWGQEEDQRRTEEAGFDRHFTKPVDPLALKELLAAGERLSEPEA